MHLTNGGSAAGTLRHTSLGGAVLSWDDVLNEGPVPAVSQEKLRLARARFLSECGWGSTRAIVHAMERRDRILELALAEDRHIVLWFEHDLYDQLQLLQILALASETGFDPEHVELLNVGSFEGKPDFAGLGELDPPELESLWPLRRPLTREQVELGVTAWTAVTSPEPTAIERLVAGETSALPFLAGALRRLLEELPDTRTGLSRSERQLLKVLQAGPRTPPEVFIESQECEEAPFDGDAWVWRRLFALGQGERPLVERDGGGPIPTPPPRGNGRTFAAVRVAITQTGRDVLAGKRTPWRSSASTAGSEACICGRAMSRAGTARGSVS
jgi:Domain of unknown function (DUF1835)